ncbi:MAG: glycogen/starch/alpha-glucan phosphorylase [Thermoanaerobaculia bacterium]
MTITNQVEDEKNHDSREEVDAIEAAFRRQMTYSLARDRYTATRLDSYQAAALTVRDRLVERWFATQQSYYREDAKRVYYLSLEFMLGRLFTSNILNLGMQSEYAEALHHLGESLEDIAEMENDAGLGNGGLGRLAACFLDSAATLSLPFYGYGIRYEFGIFRQEIVDGDQTEVPDAWLQYGNPWEIPRADVVFPVRFYGRVEPYVDEKGKNRLRWVDAQEVVAMAHDILVPGFRNNTVNFLRLWAAKSTLDFDLAKFNAGAYVAAVEEKVNSENISKVLYPPDDQYAGRELRLKQQYFFTSATIQDVLRRFHKRGGRRRQDLHNGNTNWREFPEKVAIQLNDTHPAIAIPELMRVLVDEERLDWDEAWWVTERVFSYTNHTVLPEALESWSSELIGRLLPRHMQIIDAIDQRLRKSVATAYPKDEVRLKKLAIVNDATGNVRMANLAITGSHAVNGVAQLHTEILRDATFPEHFEYFPRKLRNKTNGVTPRRWLMQANPELTALISEAIGEGWLRDLDELRQLERFAEDAGFRARWSEVKQLRKNVLARRLRQRDRFELDATSMLDVQIKRIHEYKRQLLNVLHVIDLHHRLADGETSITPRTIVFAGKASPSYRIAKMIIGLINAVGSLLRATPRSRELLAVHFVPNYDVSAAELLFPATDLSEQISTAGMEASGTGCMKAILNGAPLIGTLDGANIEIRDEVGDENMFIFGKTAAELDDIRARGYDPQTYIAEAPGLARVIETVSTIADGRFNELAEMLKTSDRYFHCADFRSYVQAQREVETVWADREKWTRISILNTARSGKFSSDRTVAQYAEDIWRATPVRVVTEESSPETDKI